MILAIFDQQINSMLPIKFQVNGPFYSGEEVQNRFSKWQMSGPSWIFYRNDFSYFDLPVTLCLIPTKFWVNWPFSSGEETKNRFSSWSPWWPSWISDQNFFFSIFDLQVTPKLPTPLQVSWPLGSGEEVWKIDVQDGCQSEWLYLFLYLQVTPIPPTKFQVSWRFGSGEEAKNRFSRCPPSWISDRNNFRYIDLQVTLILPTKFRVNWPFASGEEANKSTACGCQRSAANSKSKRGITVPKIFWGLPPLLIWVPLFIMNN